MQTAVEMNHFDDRSFRRIGSLRRPRIRRRRASMAPEQYLSARRTINNSGGVATKHCDHACLEPDVDELSSAARDAANRHTSDDRRRVVAVSAQCRLGAGKAGRIGGQVEPRPSAHWDHWQVWSAYDGPVRGSSLAEESRQQEHQAAVGRSCNRAVGLSRPHEYDGQHTRRHSLVSISCGQRNFRRLVLRSRNLHWPVLQSELRRSAHRSKI